MKAKRLAFLAGIPALLLALPSCEVPSIVEGRFTVLSGKTLVLKEIDGRTRVLPGGVDVRASFHIVRLLSPEVDADGTKVPGEIVVGVLWRVPKTAGDSFLLRLPLEKFERLLREGSDTFSILPEESGQRHRIVVYASMDDVYRDKFGKVVLSFWGDDDKMIASFRSGRLDWEYSDSIFPGPVE